MTALITAAQATWAIWAFIGATTVLAVALCKACEPRDHDDNFHDGGTW